MDRREAAKLYLMSIYRNLNLLVDFALLDAASQDALLNPWLVEKKADLQLTKDRLTEELTKLDTLIVAANQGVLVEEPK